MTALTDHVAAYLAIRRALGYQLVSDERLLIQFAGYLDARGDTRLTVDAALAWATSPPAASPGLSARRLSTVRRFALYLAAFEPGTQIPPTGLLSGHTSRSVPYIFTLTEVRALMNAARQLPAPLLAASFATLIGLMAATGLRTGEALRLIDSDLDLQAGTLLVASSKFGKTRQVPLDATTVTALRRYTRRRDRLCPAPLSPNLLLSADGHRLGGDPVSETFRALLTEVGIVVPAGRRGPRLHDLRHTFAVTTLLDWHAAGVDVQRRLPVLSTYLGHLNPVNTYWYLEAVPELMAVVAERLEAFQGGRS